MLGLITSGIGLAKGLLDSGAFGNSVNVKTSDILGTLGQHAGGFLNGISNLFGGNDQPDWREIAEYQNELQRRSIQEQKEANLELAKYEYQMNRASIQEQNYYNSPAEQMKRLKQAGLNPALMYGNGVTAASSGNQSNIAKYNAPQVERANLMNYKLAELEYGRLYQDIRLRESQIAGQDLANENQSIQNEINRQSAADQIKAYEIQNAVANKQMTFQDGLIALNKARKDSEVINQDYTNWKIGSMVYENSRNHEQAMYFRQMSGLVAQQIDNLVKQGNLTEAEIRKVNRTIDLLDLDYTERQLMVNYLKKNFERFGVPYNVWQKLGDWGGDVVGSVAKAYLSRGLSFGQSPDPLVRTSQEMYSPAGYTKTFYGYTPMSKLQF